MAFIFISYRVDDSTDAANAIYLALKQEFGESKVFFDKYRLKAGDKWPEELESNLNASEVVLILYSKPKKWLGVKVNKYGKTERRIDEPNDWVKREVERALSDQKKILIPILLSNEKLPPTDSLPESIKRITECQTIKIRKTNHDEDIDVLIKYIRKKTNNSGSKNSNDVIEEEEETLKYWSNVFVKQPLRLPGPIWTVNCDRKEAYIDGVRRHFAANYRKQKDLVYFISACPHQKPISLAKRLVYEIQDHEKITYANEKTDDQDIAVLDFKLGLDSNATFEIMWAIIENSYHRNVPEISNSNPETLKKSNHNIIAILFYVPEILWDDSDLFDHLEYFIKKFSSEQSNSSKYLLFFAFEFKSVHNERSAACQPWLNLLNQLKQKVDSSCPNMEVFHHKCLPPVEKFEIEKWFQSTRPKFTQDQISTLIEYLRKRPKPQQEESENLFDMEYIEEMQTAAYKHWHKRDT
jgi:hypothetical protein